MTSVGHGEAPPNNRSLVLDLVECIADAPRPYDELMAAWRTSCPRLPIWEDATDAGFIVRVGEMVTATPAGRAFLLAERGQRPSPRDPAGG